MTQPARVVVTGLGPISAIGIGRHDFWQGIAEGRDGRRAPEGDYGSLASTPLVAECLDFFVEDYLESEKTYLDRCSEFVLAACALALEDADLDWRELDHARFGLLLGTAYGCLDSMQNVTERVQGKGMRFASPMIFTHGFANSASSLAAIEYKVQGPATAICAGDTSSGAALQYALDIVRWGRADVMLAGGVDVLSEALLRGLDASVRGADIVPGEGACLLVLERAEDAVQRGANILGELAEVGLGHPHSATAAALTNGARRLPPVLTYGHTFGAELALRAGSALYDMQRQHETGAAYVEVTDPSGRTATAVMRGYE